VTFGPIELIWSFWVECSARDWEGDIAMEWIDYREALTRGLWLIAVLGIAGLVVGFLIPKGAVYPQYVTTTAVGAPPAENNASAIPPGVTTDQIQYYADQDATYAQADTLAKLNEPVQVVRAQVTVTGPCDNCTGSTLPGVVEVEVKAPTPEISANLNVAFDQALQNSVNDGAKALNNGNPVNTGFQVLQTTEPAFAAATKTTAQTFDSRPVRAGAGVLIGLILGVLVSLARGLLDKRVTSARRAQGAIGYPVVAEIPSETSDTSSEAYRMLWLSVFREPLPEPTNEGDQWLDGVELTSDSGEWRGLDS
jgi:capsular polysaccharide biosynthesis protein